MTKRYNLALLIIFSFVIISSSTSLVFSQTVNPANFNGSYKVKVGDTARYDYTKALSNEGNSIPIYSIHYANGTSISYNVTRGASVYVQIANINTSSSGLQQVLANVNYSFHGKTIINFNKLSNSIFLFPGFDSYSHAKSYFNNSPSTDNVTFAKSGDFIEIITSNLYNLTATSPIMVTTQYHIVINWKTGWMQKYYQKSTLSNGTIEFESQLQKQSDNILSSIINYSFGLVEVGSIVIVIAMPVFLVYNYKKYSNNPNGAHSSQSFSQYLRNRFHYTKKNQKELSGSETDKALRTIESILEETNGNKE